ncbi:MAG: hypothetical protein U0797_12860 [Gemmataceae bacterium]
MGRRRRKELEPAGVEIGGMAGGCLHDLEEVRRLAQAIAGEIGPGDELPRRVLNRCSHRLRVALESLRNVAGLLSDEAQCRREREGGDEWNL